MGIQTLEDSIQLLLQCLEDSIGSNTNGEDTALSMRIPIRDHQALHSADIPKVLHSADIPKVLHSAHIPKVLHSAHIPKVHHSAHIPSRAAMATHSPRT